MVAAVVPRIAPAPISSGISVRSLPAASFQQLSAICDHWLAKGAGYEGPASRCLFDLVHDIKALLEPLQHEEKRRLQHEEKRRQQRVRHLEQLMQQWEEVFGGGTGEYWDGDDARLRTPLSLLRALQEQEQQIAALTAQLAEAKEASAATERRCKDTLAQHQRAHREEMERQALQHEQAIEEMRAAAASQIFEGSSIRSGRGRVALPPKAAGAVKRQPHEDDADPDKQLRDQLRAQTRAMLAKLQSMHAP